METKQFHKYFNRKEIDERVIKEVKQTIKSGLFKKDKSVEHKQELITLLNFKLGNIYNIPINQLVVLEFNPSMKELMGVCGMYNKETNKIYLSNTSLVTYLHEFKHFLQDYTQQENTEDIANGYAISVYYLATPKLCENAIKKELIIYQTTFKN